MRAAKCLISLLAASAAVLSGCGYAGEPKPPALRRPMKVTDLGAVERGSKIIVTFTVPQETTEGLAITESPDVELRIGIPPSPWSQDAWAASSERVPVPAWQIPRPAPIANPRKVTASTAKAASGAKGASGVRIRTPKPTPRSGPVIDKTLFFRTVEIDASRYVGKSEVIGVRIHGPKGRDDGWSNIVPLQVLAPLPIPRNVQPTDGPNEVHLQWTADAPAFRIFRKQPKDTDWTQLGESAQPSFDDKTFEYGKTWQYYVQSVRKADNAFAESDHSEAITFTPVDRFPPAMPMGLGAISGAGTIELFWDRVTDNDLAGYRIYRNGVKIADAVLTPAYSDRTVTVGSKYSYQVSAVDQAGNESEKSAPQEITME